MLSVFPISESPERKYLELGLFDCWVEEQFSVSESTAIRDISMFPKTLVKQNGVICSTAHIQMITASQRVRQCRKVDGYCSILKTKLSSKGLWSVCGRGNVSPVVPQSTETDHAETEKCCNDDSNYTSFQMGDSRANGGGKSVSFNHGLAEACRYVQNDARFMNRRARNDLLLISRELEKLDARAKQDVALLGSGFLKLDARAREDTERIDLDVKKRAEMLQNVAAVLKSKAQSSIKSAADKHWSDGALEADLKRADIAARRRAIADSLMALEFVKNIHEMMLCKMKSSHCDSRHITLEKNGKTIEIIRRDASVDRINAIQEAYWSMATALSEADGIDYTDPEELELLVAALIDLDAMDGKSTVSLLAECSSSPDVSTRRALANALSAAPSMWTLGNAGMGALQRLVEDSNPAIAAAAAKTIKELKKQWEIEEGDTLRFIMDEAHGMDNGIEEDDDD